MVYFAALAYSADGTLLFAAGKSKYICLYDVGNLVLLQRIQTSRNKSLDGVLDVLDSRQMTEAGVADLIEDEDSEDEEYNPLPPLLGIEDETDLPGTEKKRPVLQTQALSLCPTGQRIAAATTEGILVYAVNPSLLFDPVDLEEEITTEAAISSLQTGLYSNALIIALRLKDDGLTRRCLLSTPVEKIPSVIRQIPNGYTSHMIDAISAGLRNCPDLELLLTWAKCCCTVFGSKLYESHITTTTSLKNLHEVLNKVRSELGTLVQSNLYLMQYIKRAKKTSAPTITDSAEQS